MIELKNIEFRYNNDRPILKNINLEFKRNEVVGLFGSSGYGKSTLPKIVTGLLKSSQGEVYLDEKNLPEKGYSSVQLIYQHPEKAVKLKWKMKDILKLFPQVRVGVSMAIFSVRGNLGSCEFEVK